MIFLDEYKLLTNDNTTDVARVPDTTDGRARNWTNNKGKGDVMVRCRELANGFFIKQEICATCVICRKRPTTRLIGCQGIMYSEIHILCFQDAFAQPVCAESTCKLIARKPVLHYKFAMGMSSTSNMLTCDRCLSFVGDMKLCEVCECVTYCSEECQQIHVRRHGPLCKSILTRCGGRQKQCA